MSHSYSQNHLHIVFSTKDRQKLIEPAMPPKLWSRLLSCQRSFQHPCRNAGPHARVTAYPLPGSPTATQLIPERRRFQVEDLTLRQCQRLAVRLRTAGL